MDDNDYKNYEILSIYPHNNKENTVLKFICSQNDIHDSSSFHELKKSQSVCF